MSDVQARIGTSLEGVLIRVIQRQFPESNDKWDGNWLESPIHISVGRYDATLPAQLRVDELISFRTALEAMNETLIGSADLVSMDGWLKLTMTCLTTGALKVVGEADDNPGIGNKLRFELTGMDQSFLPTLIDELAAIENAFPLRGE
jgi:hypothetical protein